MRGLPAVAIVETDHVQTPRSKILAKGRGPADPLRAQTGDQQDRRGIRLAKAVIGQFHAIGLNDGHDLALSIRDIGPGEMQRIVAHIGGPCLHRLFQRGKVMREERA